MWIEYLKVYFAIKFSVISINFQCNASIILHVLPSILSGNILCAYILLINFGENYNV